MEARRIRRREAERRLDPMKGFMGEHDAPNVGVVRDRRPDEHRPALAFPVDGRVGDDDALGQRADKEVAHGVKHAAGVRLVGDDEARLRIDEERRAVEPHPPETAAFLVGDDLVLGEERSRLGQIDRWRLGGGGRGAGKDRGDIDPALEHRSSLA